MQYSKPMDRVNTYFHLLRRNHVFHLNFFLTGLACLSLLAWLLNTVPPEWGSVIFFGLVLIMLTVYCFLFSVISNVRRSLLISGGVGILLALRALQLYDPLYVILLFAMLLSLDYALRKK